MKIVMFSKNVDSLPLDKAAISFKEMGFDGVDVTVRPAIGSLPPGRVQPEKVKQDLPKVVRAFEDAGLEVPMISAGIASADDEFARETFETAGSLGIRAIRLKLWSYNGFGTFKGEMEEVRRRVEGLERLSKETGVQSVIHVHSGSVMSANPFVVWYWIKDRDPGAIGAYVDFEHITLESAPASRAMALELFGKRINVVAIKDFAWKATKGGQLATELVPIHVPVGQGVVPWEEVFGDLKSLDVDPIVSVHSEYFGQSSWQDLTVPELIKQTTADVKFLREVIQKTNESTR